MDAQLQRDLNQVINRIRGISGAISKEARDELKEAAGPLLLAIKTAAPKGTKTHKRYVSHGGKKRAEKGSGNVAATYKPGNLKRSYRILRFRRSKLAVFVGVKLGGKVDGYYAHMVNNDTENVDGSTRTGKGYVDQAVSSIGPAVLSDSIRRISKLVNKYWISSMFKSSPVGGAFESGFYSKYAKIKGRQ
jgi:hypothetical protein